MILKDGSPAAALSAKAGVRHSEVPGKMLWPWMLAAAVLSAATAHAGDDFDEFSAKDIMRTCAPCHGAFGQGGVSIRGWRG